MYVDIEVYRGDDNIFITRCPELNLYANGKTQKEAVAKLKKKITEFINKRDFSPAPNHDIMH